MSRRRKLRSVDRRAAPTSIRPPSWLTDLLPNEGKIREETDSSIESTIGRSEDAAKERRRTRDMAKVALINAIEAARQAKKDVYGSYGPPPVTDANLEPYLTSNIDRAIEVLESMRDNQMKEEQASILRVLDGTWQLIFSKQDEIRKLESLTPFGVQLGPVFNRINVSRGVDYRLALITHKLNLFSAEPATLVTYIDDDLRIARSGNDLTRVVVFMRAPEEKTDMWNGRTFVEGRREE
eukprot:jgi/Bigna1/125989/aug1.1_g697